MRRQSLPLKTIQFDSCYEFAGSPHSSVTLKRVLRTNKAKADPQDYKTYEMPPQSQMRLHSACQSHNEQKPRSFQSFVIQNRIGKHLKMKRDRKTGIRQYKFFTDTVVTSSIIRLQSPYCRTLRHKYIRSGNSVVPKTPIEHFSTRAKKTATIEVMQQLTPWEWDTTRQIMRHRREDRMCGWS